MSIDKLAEHRIDPKSVTKPLQLLAAWLVGLILINATFLTAAASIARPWWAPGALVIGAIANVPVFLVALFLLQTRFRPEMQEDTFYSRYLEKQQATQVRKETEQSITTLRTDVFEANSKILGSVESLQNQIATIATALPDIAKRINPVAEFNQAPPSLEAEIRHTALEIAETKRQLDWARFSFRVNDLLPAQAEIHRQLGALGVTSVIPFGSSSQFPHVPGIQLMVVGGDLPVSHIQELIRIAQKAKFDGFSIEYLDIFMSRTTVYFGAYNYFTCPLVRLTEENLGKFLQPGLSQGEMNALFKLHRRIPSDNLRALIGKLPNLEAKAMALEIGLDSNVNASLETISATLELSPTEAKRLVLNGMRALDREILKEFSAA